MATIYRDEDADPGALEGRTIATVGYGNQGLPFVKWENRTRAAFRIGDAAEGR